MPAHPTQKPSNIGILLINLGTPAAPTVAAVRTYLREFLSDPRVVEISRWLWKPLLHGVILNTRPKKSALKYGKIWKADGSPLRIYSERQAKLLQGRFVHAGIQNVLVEIGMRYGEPSVQNALTRLKEKHCERILVLPLYPQYAASTTASAFDAVAQALKPCRNLPELRFVRSFPDHPGYISVLADSVHKHWQRNGRAEKLVISFHGAPRFTYDKGDPYYDECLQTAALLTQELGLNNEHYVVSFQSRFGKAEWLKPYTQPTLIELAKQGVSSVDVICPGFVSDCLETLEEIAMDCKTSYLAAGGQEFNYIPALNDQHAFIEVLFTLSQEHMTTSTILPAEK